MVYDFGSYDKVKNDVEKLRAMILFYNEIYHVVSSVLDKGRHCKVKINGKVCLYEEIPEFVKKVIAKDYKGICGAKDMTKDDMDLELALENLERKSREYYSVHALDTLEIMGYVYFELAK